MLLIICDLCDDQELYRAATAAAAALAISRSASTVPPDTPMAPMNFPVLVLKSKHGDDRLVPGDQVTSAPPRQGR